MTKDQKNYINQVILTRLIEMAIDDELPSDMNELSYHDFEEATQQFNSDHIDDTNRAERIIRLGCYISTGDVENALTLLENASVADVMDDVVTMCDMHEDMGHITVDTFIKNYL